MTGRIVHRPTVVERHVCAPPPPRGGYDPEGHASDEPAGTVWECDCGRTWKAGRGRWNPEGWFARWRRQRRQHRDGYMTSTNLLTGETTVEPLPKPISPGEFTGDGWIDSSLPPENTQYGAPWPPPRQRRSLRQWLADIGADWLYWLPGRRRM